MTTNFRRLFMNTGEPFGLPNGTVRGLLAIIFTIATVYLWVTGSPVPTELLVINSLVVGNYFGSRSGNGDTNTGNVSVTKIEPPYIPGEQEDK